MASAPLTKVQQFRFGRVGLKFSGSPTSGIRSQEYGLFILCGLTGLTVLKIFARELYVDLFQIYMHRGKGAVHSPFVQFPFFFLPVLLLI